MIFLSFSLTLLNWNNVSAQINFSGSAFSFGRGTSVSTAIDYFALNSNPSNLGWQSQFYAHKFSFKIWDGSLMVKSKFTDNLGANLRGFASGGSSLPLPGIKPIGEISWSYDESIPHDTLLTLDNRLTVRDYLTDRNEVKFNRTLFAGSYHHDKWGTFAIQVNNEIVGSLKFSQNLASLFTLGKVNPYFDSLVLSSGAVIANDPSLYTNSMLVDVVHAFSTDTLTFGEQATGSEIRLIKTRNYSLGWGNEVKQLFPNWQTFIGANLNVIAGNYFIDMVAKDNEFFWRGAGTSKNVGNSRGFHNPGYGASGSFGMSLIKEKKWILGASLNNLGFIHWRSTNYVTTTEYNSLNEENLFDYPFGTSKDTSYYDQWAAAGLYLSEGENYQEGGRFTTATASNLSLGGQWKANRHIALSADVILPIIPKAIGSYRTIYLAVGTEFEFAHFALSMGMNNNFQQFNLPVGVTFGGLNSMVACTISTMNVLGFFQSTETSTKALAAGLVFRFK